MFKVNNKDTRTTPDISSYLLNDLMNFDEIFEENVTHDINSHKEAGLQPVCKK